MRSLIAVLLLAYAALAQSTLPVKRVVLFKNGVGYFEHVGPVRGNDSVTIAFTSGQLNDVLKSLTVLDLNGGRIAGVAYGSAAPLDRQLDDLRLPIGEKATLSDVLGALRGTKLEIRNGATTIAGRLLSIERKTRIAAGATLEVDYLSLISDAGELKTTEISPGFSVRLLEPGLAGRVGRYLDILSASREADVRRMVISTEGSGDRSLYVSYISEVPVWKSTYRIVLNAKPGQSPLLQGWAIIDNVVGEDWKNVELSLVAGAPQSFIQNLSQPYYTQRPTVALPDNVSVTPQTHESTLIPEGAQLTGLQVGSVAQTVEVTSASAATQTNSSNLTSARTSGSGGSLGSGAALGSGNRRGSGSGSGLGPGSGGGFGGGTYHVDTARAAAEAAARSQALGDLFEYKLKDPITILKNQSALVPIAQSPITVEKVSIWNEQAGLLRPQRALWITNSTGLTLDGGTVSVLEEDTFAGEGVMDPIRPAEKRLFSYATDLALNASSRIGSEQQRVSRVRIDHGTMTQQSEIREKKTYTFRNADSTARTIIVERPVRAGYVLRGDVHPAETTADWLLFRVQVDPKQTTSLVVEEARPTESLFGVTNISSEQLELFLTQKSIDPNIEKALRGVLAQKDAIATLEAQKSNRQADIEKIFDDQQRLRENMKALKGSPEEKLLLQRYTQQLNEQETRLATLQKEIEQINTQVSAETGRLDTSIQQLSFDVKL